MALFPSGRKGHLWASGSRCHRWDRRYFTVILFETLLSGEWYEDRYDLAMKTNRILYPEGKRVSAAELAASLDPGYFHPITVKSRTYMVYRYEGPLNKIDHAVVLLSYPADAIGKKSALRVFLCSDPSLSDEVILEYYSHRWSIEVMFRSHKRYTGLKSFMVRTTKALDRLLLILALAQFFFSCGLGRIVPFHSGIRLCRAAFGKF